jgi:undecaprenyl-phosphate 4-deoxy-4-formamido-L-arabinose transferase
MAISLVSLLGFVALIIRRLVHGSEAEGLFTLFAIAFFLIGVLLMGVGVVGEYVGRIYEQVRQRPRYTVAALLEQNDPQPAETAALQHEAEVAPATSLPAPVTENQL